MRWQWRWKSRHSPMPDEPTFKELGVDWVDAFMKERTKVYTDVARQMGLGTKQ